MLVDVVARRGWSAPRRARSGGGHGARQASRRPVARYRGLAERPDLVVRELPPRARLEPAVGERADAHPHEPLHRVADGLAHPADLAVAALVDGDAQHARSGWRDLGRRGEAVVELDAVAEPAHSRRRSARRRDLGEVLLLDAVGWGG